MIAALFALTAFLGSFLLFLVQPMIGKWLLPTFGGAPAVWTTSLVFFQAALLVGYLLAHLGLGHLSARRQSMLHLGLLLTGILCLPPLREGLLADVNPESPVRGVFTILAMAVGWSFTILSAGSPVLQAWYARLSKAGFVSGEPWGLYAAGNAGSLLALLCYPFFIEPTFTLGQQSDTWSKGYLLLILSYACCVWFLWRAERSLTHATPLPESGPAVPSTASTETGVSSPPGYRQCARWVLLAAIPSALLNSLTGFITTDLAPIPLLWIGPLALYLLSFVIVFTPRGNRYSWLPGPIVALIFLPVLITTENTLHWPIWFSVGHHLLLATTIFLLFHGLLVRERPEPRYLSAFYLWMSFGGLLGGMSSSLGAPLIFSSHSDYPLLLLVAGGLLGYLPLVRPEPLIESDSPRARAYRSATYFGLFMMSLGLFWRFARVLSGTPLMVLIPTVGGPILIFIVAIRIFRWFPILFLVWMGINMVNAREVGTTLLATRNFFGSVRVATMREQGAHLLFHGNICHGSQGWTDELRRTPFAYYAPSSSIHQALSWMQFRNRSMHIGVVGLGTGALAAYARPLDTITFFEIDPKIIQIARNPDFFTFLSDCRGTLKIIEADGRLGIRRSPAESFDVLIFDAYSSDAIPIHLLTKEAVAEYLGKLKPNGILVFHLSNQYLNLRPVLGNIVTVLGLEGWSSYDEPQLFPDRKVSDLEYFLTYGAIWSVVTRPSHPIKPLFDDLAWKQLGFRPNIPLWTDDRAAIGDLYTWR